jgi:hypothetical protein
MANDNEGWTSTPTLFHRPATGKSFAYAGLIFGSVFLCVAVYVIAVELHFYANAIAVEGVIVGVRHDHFPAGKGSELGYAPIVELKPTRERADVETYSAENIYPLGAEMPLLCDASTPRRCIKSTFWELWIGVATLFFAITLFAPSVFYLWNFSKYSLSLAANPSERESSVRQ